MRLSHISMLRTLDVTVSTLFLEQANKSFQWCFAKVQEKDIKLFFESVFFPVLFLKWFIKYLFCQHIIINSDIYHFLSPKLGLSLIFRGLQIHTGWGSWNLHTVYQESTRLEKIALTFCQIRPGVAVHPELSVEVSPTGKSHSYRQVSVLLWEGFVEMEN